MLSVDTCASDNDDPKQIGGHTPGLCNELVNLCHNSFLQDFDLRKKNEKIILKHFQSTDLKM